jgi:hypothetical protein
MERNFPGTAVNADVADRSKVVGEEQGLFQILELHILMLDQQTMCRFGLHSRMLHEITNIRLACIIKIGKLLRLLSQRLEPTLYGTTTISDRYGVRGLVTTLSCHELGKLYRRAVFWEKISLAETDLWVDVAPALAFQAQYQPPEQDLQVKRISTPYQLHITAAMEENEEGLENDDSADDTSAGHFLIQHRPSHLRSSLQ